MMVQVGVYHEVLRWPVLQMVGLETVGRGSGLVGYQGRTSLFRSVLVSPTAAFLVGLHASMSVRSPETPQLEELQRPVLLLRNSEGESLFKSRHSVT